MMDDILKKEIEAFKIQGNDLIARMNKIDQTNLSADSIASIEFIKTAVMEEIQYQEQAQTITTLVEFIELDRKYEQKYDKIAEHLLKLIDDGVVDENT